jgi:hypothetical protein
MTERTRRLLLVFGALIVAGILAFPLRETIYDSVVIPVAFIGWNLDLMYRSFSQQIWWWAIVFVVLYMLVYSLVPRPRTRRTAEARSKPPLGQVESLAGWLQRAERGIYFKWLIANRLGKLAYQILLHRESGRPRSVFAPLVSADWEPSKDLQKYLETGLHGSFVEFPNVKRPFGTSQKTPLDYDLANAVEFLESKVENAHSPQRH